MNNKSVLAIILSLALQTAFAKEQSSQDPNHPPSLQVIEKELKETEAEFQTAKQMFNPWYAGPLLTPSAHNLPPRNYLLQGYVFVTDTFATFDKNRKSRSISDIISVNTTLVYQMGLTQWLDFALTLQSIYNHQSGRDAYNIGDTSVTFGIPLMKETPYRPAVRLAIAESFPTGKYNHLNRKKNGIDATGSGSYETTFSLNISKVIWWISTHPMQYRFSFNYTIPTLVNVERFNAYGGGFKTKGRIHPGNAIDIDTAIELSFTKHWVFALDLVYSYQNHSTFSGKKGRDINGMIASVGAPSNDQFSAAPAIEYNPSENLNFLAGVWFTITGRNSSDFVSGIISLLYVW